MLSRFFLQFRGGGRRWFLPPHMLMPHRVADRITEFRFQPQVVFSRQKRVIVMALWLRNPDLWIADQLAPILLLPFAR